MDDMEALAGVVARAIQVSQAGLLASYAGLLARVDLLEKQVATTGRDGRDGKDADMVAIAGLVKTQVSEAVAALPLPVNGRDGKDGTSVDISHIDAVIAERLDLAVKALPLPANGADGKDGMSVTVEDVAPLVKSAVGEALSALPPPPRGEKGEPGASVSDDVVEALVVQHVSKAFSDVTLPKDGTSVTPADVAPMITAEVARAFAMVPVPRDAVGLTSAFIDRDEHLVLTLSDGATKDVGRVVGRDVDMSVVTQQVQAAIDAIPKPKDGRDGVDGMGFEDIVVEHDGERAFTLTFVRGEVTKTFGAFVIPAQIYRGVYKSDTVYVKGDVVTWGGHQWTCIEDTTTAKPGEIGVESRAWQQSVKRGSEGKQGLKGENGLDGKDGRHGADLTQMDTDGRKWG